MYSLKNSVVFFVLYFYYYFLSQFFAQIFRRFARIFTAFCPNMEGGEAGSCPHLGSYARAVIKH